MLNQIGVILRQNWPLLSAGHYVVRQEALGYHCRLTSPRRKNLLHQAVNRLVGGEPALPHILHVGVTTVCNLRCAACPTGRRTLGRDSEHLDFDLYRRTLDELRDALLFVLFWDWGEPLLHPRLPEMIEHAASLGMMTVVSTNGNAANSEPEIERLVRAAPNVVIVCVDGADQATYEQYRGGGKLSKALDTVRRLRHAKDQLASQYPLVEFRSLALRQNEGQFPELLSLAEECGADLFSVKSLRPYDYRGTSVDESLVPLAPELARYRYEDARRRGAEERTDFVRQGPLRCARPYHSPALNADGTLAFCSYATNELELFGDIGNDGFIPVWRSRFARDIRSRFTRNGGSECCGTCYFRSDHKPTILHQVPLRPAPPRLEFLCPETKSRFLERISQEATAPETGVV